MNSLLDEGHFFCSTAKVKNQCDKFHIPDNYLIINTNYGEPEMLDCWEGVLQEAIQAFLNNS